MNEQNFIEGYLPKELSKEELIIHFNKYKLGSSKSRDLLIIHNIKLVYYYVYKNYNNNEYDIKELISVGIIGLINAVDTYEIGKSEFSTYAIKCINNEIVRLFRKKRIPTKSLEEVYYQDKNGNEIKLEDTIKDDTVNLVEQYEEKEIYLALRKYIEKLDNINRQIIKLYFGFETKRQHTQREISEILNICPSQINRKLKRSLAIIKENIIADGLAEITLITNKIDKIDLDSEFKDIKTENKKIERHKRALINKISNNQIENLSQEEIEKLISLIQVYIENLEDPRIKIILKLYYGFFDNKEYSYNEIINKIYLSRSYISQIIQIATDEMLEHFIEINIINNERQINKKRILELC